MTPAETAKIAPENTEHLRDFVKSIFRTPETWFFTVSMMMLSFFVLGAFTQIKQNEKDIGTLREWQQHVSVQVSFLTELQIEARNDIKKLLEREGLGGKSQ
jgi:cell division protein FtsX